MFIVASEGHEVSSELVFQFIVQGLTDRVTVGTVTALVKRGGGGASKLSVELLWSSKCWRCSTGASRTDAQHITLPGAYRKAGQYLKGVYLFDVGGGAAAGQGVTIPTPVYFSQTE